MTPLPDQWTVEAVGDLFEIQLGKMLSKKAKAGTSPFPYLANRHVQWGQVDLSDLEWMDFTDAERKKFSLLPNDLLVCEGGEVGRTAIWREELEDCYFQKAVHRLRPKDGRVLPEFMYRFMEQAARKGLFSRLTSQTSIAHLTKDKLALLEMPLPPLPEQRRIAAILDKADAIRRKRQETVRLTEEFLRSAFLDMFGDPVTNPKGWPMASVAELAGRVVVGHVGPTSQGYADQGIPFLRTQNVRRMEVTQQDLRHITPEFHARLRKSVVHRSDVLISRVGANRGMAAVVPAELDGANCANIIVITPGGKVQSSYLAFLVNSALGQRELLGGTVGSAQGVINTSAVKRWTIPVPERDVQHRFDVAVKGVISLDRKSEGAAESTEELFQALVQRAFRGDL